MVVGVTLTSEELHWHLDWLEHVRTAPVPWYLLKC